MDGRSAGKPNGQDSTFIPRWRIQRHNVDDEDSDRRQQTATVSDYTSQQSRRHEQQQQNQQQHSPHPAEDKC